MSELIQISSHMLQMHGQLKCVRYWMAFLSAAFPTINSWWLIISIVLAKAKVSHKTKLLSLGSGLWCAAIVADPTSSSPGPQPSLVSPSPPAFLTFPRVAAAGSCCQDLCSCKLSCPPGNICSVIDCEIQDRECIAGAAVSNGPKHKSPFQRAVRSHDWHVHIQMPFPNLCAHIYSL